MMSEQSASSAKVPKTGLVKRLENNIESMKQRNFKGCKRLFQKLQEKRHITWTIENIGIAVNWLDKLKSYFLLAGENAEIANFIFIEFQKPETKESASFLKFLYDEALNLSKKIIVIENNLSDVYARFVFKHHVDAGNENVQAYEGIGRELSREAESHPASDPSYPATFREITKLASATYLKVKDSTSFVVPSIIICASSGTGKTQVPFSLDIPLIYCSLETDSQGIYTDLGPFSQYFC